MAEGRNSQLSNLADADTTSEISDDEQNELPLTVLFKSIKPFNGDRRELNTFIQNTNSAFSLAQPIQKNSLLLYVASQLSTNVANELEYHILETNKKET